MPSKRKIRESKLDLIRKKKKVRNNLIKWSLIVSPFIVLLIGTLIFETVVSNYDFYTQFKNLFYLAEIYLIFLNSIFMMIWLFLYFKYRSYKVKLFKGEYTLPGLENPILQFLIDNKGKKYTSLSIQKVINHHGRIEELNKILEHMVHEKKLRVEILDFTPYYSVNLD